MDEATFNQMFEKSQQNNAQTAGFTEEESKKFRNAFQDPEFRKMFSEYMDEMQDPKNRAENEAYIAQLENEKKVPEGKELIRPDPAFVAKTHKIKENGVVKNEKLFINIVHSSKINPPTKSVTAKGNCWSVPYSLGPPHMEKDKRGNNAPCFDCCFHPDAVAMGRKHKEFLNLLVHTSMEGVELTYKNNQRQEVVLDRTFHLVEGVTYKQGQVLTMMIPIAAKSKWVEGQQQNVQEQPKTSSIGSPVRRTASPSAVSSPSTGSRAAVSTAASSSASSPDSTTPTSTDGSAKSRKQQSDTPPNTSSDSTTTGAAAAHARPAIKKGFLNSNKGAGIYDDKLTTIRGREAAKASAPGVSFRDNEEPTSPLVDNSSVSTSKLISEVSSATSASSTTNRSDKQTNQPSVKDDFLTARSTTVKKTVTTPAEQTTPATEPETVSADGTSTTGPAVPKYTVKERGAVDLGDFEAMRRRTVAGSSRPNELVYRVELPLVTKASQVELDVAERQLSLKYQDVYRLVVALPYPVWDTKGAAKYDKATKSLTVTLPVKQQEPQIIGSSPSKSVVSNVDTTVNNDLDAATSDSSSVSPSKSNTSNTKDGAASHARWVAPVNQSSQQLAAEIAEKARLALQEAEAAAALAKTTEQQSPAKKTTTEKDVAASAPAQLTKASTTSIAAADCDFEPSAAFSGRRPGMVFRNGDLGVGYYADTAMLRPKPAASASATKQDATPPVKTPDTATSTATVSPKAYTSFPFALKQTREAVALLVQVAGVLKDTVKVEYREYGVDVQFQAAAAEGAKEPLVYGSTIQFPRSAAGKGFNTAQCKFDVAARNMVIVLTKSVSGIWLPTEGDRSASDSNSEPVNVPHSVEPYNVKTETDINTAAANTKILEKVVPPVAKSGSTSSDSTGGLIGAMQAMQFSSASGNLLYELD